MNPIKSHKINIFKDNFKSQSKKSDIWSELYGCEEQISFLF